MGRKSEKVDRQVDRKRVKKVDWQVDRQQGTEVNYQDPPADPGIQQINVFTVKD